MRNNFYRAKIASTDNKLNVIKLSHTQKKQTYQNDSKSTLPSQCSCVFIILFLLLFTDNKNCVLCLSDTLPHFLLFVLHLHPTVSVRAFMVVCENQHEKKRNEKS